MGIFIRAALDAFKPTIDQADQQPQPKNNRLLERIGQATELRDSNTRKRQGRIEKLAKPPKDRLDQIGRIASQRHQQQTAIAKELTGIGQQIGAIHTRQLSQTTKLGPINRRLNVLKDDYAEHADQLTNTASGIRQLFGAAKEIGLTFKDKLTTAFGKLAKDIKGMDLVDMQTNKKLSAKEKEELVYSNPFSLSWYNFLRSEMKQWKKRKTYDNTPRL